MIVALAQQRQTWDSVLGYSNLADIAGKRYSA